MICSLEKQIISTYYNDYKLFFLKPNVQGIGFGYKYVNGVCTCDPSIHVFVNKKVAENCLPSNGVIPKLYKGIKTDVIETGNFTMDECNGNISNSNISNNPAYVDRIRPIEPSYCVSSASPFFTGTFGYIVIDNLQISRTYCLLGTWTAFTREGQSSVGTQIIQPASFYGGTAPNDVVGNLLRFVPVRHSSHIPNSLQEFNLVNSAIASYVSVGEVQLINPWIPDIGIPVGIVYPTVLKEIQWTGCISGNQKGSIISVGSVIKVTFGIFSEAYFRDVVIIGGEGCYSGDFGALVCDLNKNAMGVLFANTEGANRYNVFCTMENIQNELNVTLLTC